MTIFLSEGDAEGLLDMREAVEVVEVAFREEGEGEATNSPRTRSRGPASVLNVMHASLSYLGRSGLKAYAYSKAGTKFVVALFDSSDSTPLAIMGADALGRYRTGAASAVATKYLYRKRSATLALLGTGKQAMTQVTALGVVTSLEEVRVWSPNQRNRAGFVARLAKSGVRAKDCGSARDALEGAQIATAITSAKDPFLTQDLVGAVSHVNLCGGNVPTHSEIAPGALGTFQTVVVDDVTQAKNEYGDLILAADAGSFSWDSALKLCDVVTGKAAARGRTLFKSGGVALEDVALASALYDKARSDPRYPGFSFG
ncbi:MAG: ornithine cyclodeaminase family protein [Nitrososphaerota archaeon]|nr:ornithine cyclodeaminase family protein [Nitrososphaerota archaeon]